MLVDKKLEAVLRALSVCFTSHNWRLTTAESCTGGGISYAITSMPGSSAWFERAFVAYSNQAKMHLLGVEPAVINEHGAVSRDVVLQMASGAVAHSDSGYAISVSGIAGPDGGSEEKPVGLVWFGFVDETGLHHAVHQHFSGNRQSVREQSVRFALTTAHELWARASLSD